MQLGLIGIFSLFIITVHAIICLVRCREYINEREIQDAKAAQRQPRLVSSYGEVGSFVFGRAGTLIIDMMLFFTQGGFCIAYLVCCCSSSFVECQIGQVELIPIALGLEMYRFLLVPTCLTWCIIQNRGTLFC